MSFGYRSRSARRDVRALHPRALGQRSQLLVGILGGDLGLSLVGFGNELPECIVRGLRNAVGVSGALCRPIVHLQGKVLKDKARVRFRSNETLDCRLCGLARRTLQVAELDDRDWCILRPARRSGNTFLQRLLRWIERLGSEWNDVAN